MFYNVTFAVIFSTNRVSVTISLASQSLHTGSTVNINLAFAMVTDFLNRIGAFVRPFMF